MLNNEVKQILKDAKCDFYKYGDSIGLTIHYKDFENIDFINFEKEILNFIKDKTSLISTLNKKLKELNT